MTADQPQTIERTPQEKLVHDIKVTTGSRFNAAARLSQRERSSNVLVSVYSALLICTSIATLALPLGSTTIRYASFGGIVASILVLVMSMRNFAHRYGVEAEQMHRCALELNELKRKIATDVGASSAKLASYTEQYSRILEKWNINHNQDDFLNYKYKHKWEFEDIASVPDKDLPNRRFQEYYSISAAGVAILTLVGVALTLAVAWFVWDSIAPTPEPYTAASAQTNTVSDMGVQNELNAVQATLENASRVLNETNASDSPPQGRQQSSRRK